MPQKNLIQLQQEVDQIIKKFGGYWPPLSMHAAISEEVGELAREINAIEGFKPKKNKNGSIKTNNIQFIGEELGDILFSVICVANFYKLDLHSEFERILAKYAQRDEHRYSPSA